MTPPLSLLDLTDVVGHICLFLNENKVDIVALAGTCKELNTAVQLQAFKCNSCSVTLNDAAARTRVRSCFVCTKLTCSSSCNNECEYCDLACCANCEENRDHPDACTKCGGFERMCPTCITQVDRQCLGCPVRLCKSCMGNRVPPAAWAEAKRDGYCENCDRVNLALRFMRNHGLNADILEGRIQRLAARAQQE